MPGLVIEFGQKKKGSLADEIASKIPNPSKLRKSAAMQDSGDEEDSGNAAAESALEAFWEAQRKGDAKAGVRAFKLLDSLACGEDEDETQDEEDAEDEE